MRRVFLRGRACCGGVRTLATSFFVSRAFSTLRFRWGDHSVARPDSFRSKHHDRGRAPRTTCAHEQPRTHFGGGAAPCTKLSQEKFLGGTLGDLDRPTLSPRLARKPAPTSPVRLDPALTWHPARYLFASSATSVMSSVGPLPVCHA